ncbi:hypothetical protein RJT34_04367 [Clitoria ternatea]|uniref:NAC domain-containing protein n=1 Tax=Clitoria ternatea TaxID=43366 RepID=A0AAN9KPK5_CLITE
MDSTDSSSASRHPHLPPGFRFHPTDEELVVHYLKRRAASSPLPVAIIAEVDLYKFDPWELPSKATFGEQEWYFFSPRDRKYPNGARPNRAATSGYWKATGTGKPILTSNEHQKVGVKKALVFYGGKPPKGVKTNWIMHEYRLVDGHSFSSSSKPHPLTADPPNCNKKNSLRLDDWVLCRIYKKSINNNTLPRPPLMEHDEELSMENMLPTMSTLSMANNMQNSKPSSSRSPSYDASLGLENGDNFFDGILGDQGMQNGSDNSHHNIVSPNSKGNADNNTSTFPMKRSLTPQLWNETASPGSSTSSKRFHGDLNSGSSIEDNNNSFVSLLNQLPQNAAFQPNANFLGSVEDGSLRQQFQLQGLNWN